MANGAGTENKDLEGIREAMQFDPFRPGANFGSGEEGSQQQGDDQGEGEGEGEGQTQGQDQGEGSAEGGKAGTPQGQQTAPAKQPASGDGTQPAGEGTDEENRALQDTIARLLNGGQPKAQEPAKPEPQQSQAHPQPGQPQPQPQAPAYNFQIGREIVEALGSDDPAQSQAALSAVVNSVMNRIASDFKQALDQLESRIMETVPQVVGQTTQVQTAQQSIEQDFYSHFPALNNPVLKQTIWGMIFNLGQSEGLKEWNSDFRDRAGKAIHQVLKIPYAAPQAQAQGGTPAPAPRRKTFASGGSGGGARPAPNAADVNQFLEVLGAGQS